MKLFRISQEENSDYFTYDSVVVAAPDEQTARVMDPSSGREMTEWDSKYNGWCTSADKVVVEYLGEAVTGVKQGIICSSFNAG